MLSKNSRSWGIQRHRELSVKFSVSCLTMIQNNFTNIDLSLDSSRGKISNPNREAFFFNEDLRF